MDAIEEGFNEILRQIEEEEKNKEKLSDEVMKNSAALLEKMSEKAAPLVKKHGINMLVKARTDMHGEMYDKIYSDKKMFVLGKTEPMPYRPDDMTKKVQSQFCTLSEDGSLEEVMYSSTEILTDSYIQEISSKEAVDIYGTEIIFMLYKSFAQYLDDEKELVSALEKTVSFILEK
ncbi:hypothetical protein J2128_002106 [Methanomicrobium sp. W14]|uniref:hypothetical protein n=1 Tax=Methanomicrobium sp. W14 TaxID=2817839 RepID=UPI001AE5D630|nr:hypothetical protein [Methanomicrobium sp. W14]MBP2134140.1 hypothetical protein [Methanomicrobium sp. W14]